MTCCYKSSLPERAATAFLLCLLFLCRIEAPAQVPGYLGKRFVLTMDMNLAPAIAYGLAEDLWGPNFRLGFNGEYVLSRRFSAGAGLYGLTTRARYTNDSLVRGISRVNTFAAGLHVRFYNFLRRGNIAPLGPYHKLEVLYLRYQMSDLDRRFYPDGREDLGSYNDVAFTYTFGTQRILYKNITWHVGVQIGTLASLFSATFVTSAPPEDLGAARLIRHFSIAFNGGIGLLLF